MTLAESSALAQQAELLVAQVPEVQHVGRRSGRAELDEHAEGVHVSELDVGLLPASELKRSMEEITADIRSRLAHLPGSIGIGQPISHRIDHMLSGCARRSPSRCSARTWTSCAGRRICCAPSWPEFRGLLTWRSKSRS